MAIAINPTDQVRYVLLADRDLPPEQQTTWLLCPLTNVQRKLVEDGSLIMDRGGTVMPRVGASKMNILRAGLSGWENLRDIDGNIVEFVAERSMCNVLGSNVRPLTAASLNRVHPDDLEELIDAIQNAARPTVAEGKA